MGWMSLKRNHTADVVHISPTKTKDLGSEHVEYAQIDIPDSREYPPVPLELPDNQLPFMPASTVTEKDSGGDRLWIVVDNIIYDCTDFASEHPGGSSIIKGFGGKDCSWQFWRFHSRAHMEEFGKTLRVGRTKGVENPFKEPPRFVGLRRMANTDEAW
jgi:cytochrome b involved in lipid metabolism